ncbi:hypothetical protein PR048_009552 [Dryococelus australis]|uniref:Uncharacterized protein n=1 Tax=Dryococelus australis TaxID=614101 RepID=A0ABQ9I0Z1_9NEOP|nr:hypothetical protein PR048_009552 [Dryococelus australis]
MQSLYQISNIKVDIAFMASGRTIEAGFGSRSGHTCVEYMADVGVGSGYSRQRSVLKPTLRDTCCRTWFLYKLLQALVHEQVRKPVWNLPRTIGLIQLPNLVLNLALLGSKCHGGCHTSQYTGRYGGWLTLQKLQNLVSYKIALTGLPTKPAAANFKWGINGRELYASQGSAPYAYKVRNPCKGTFIAAERDWVAIPTFGVMTTSLSVQCTTVVLGPCSIPGGVAPGFSHVGIATDDAAGQRVFSGISRFPRPFIPTLLHHYLVSPSSALKTSVCPVIVQLSASRRDERHGVPRTFPRLSRKPHIDCYRYRGRPLVLGVAHGWLNKIIISEPDVLCAECPRCGSTRQVLPPPIYSINSSPNTRKDEIVRACSTLTRPSPVKLSTSRSQLRRTDWGLGASELFILCHSSPPAAILFAILDPGLDAEVPVGDVGAGSKEVGNVSNGVLGTSVEKFDGSIEDFVGVTAEEVNGTVVSVDDRAALVTVYCGSDVGVTHEEVDGTVPVRNDGTALVEVDAASDVAITAEEVDSELNNRMEALRHLMRKSVSDTCVRSQSAGVNISINYSQYSPVSTTRTTISTVYVTISTVFRGNSTARTTISTVCNTISTACTAISSARISQVCGSMGCVSGQTLYAMTRVTLSGLAHALLLSNVVWHYGHNCSRVHTPKDIPRWYSQFAITSNFPEPLLKFYLQDIPLPHANKALPSLENYAKGTTHRRFLYCKPRRMLPGIGCQVNSYQALIGERRSDILVASYITLLACTRGARGTSGYFNSVTAVDDKMSTFEINLRKKSLPLPAYILTGALSDMRPVKGEWLSRGVSPDAKPKLTRSMCMCVCVVCNTRRIHAGACRRVLVSKQRAADTAKTLCRVRPSIDTLCTRGKGLVLTFPKAALVEAICNSLLTLTYQLLHDRVKGNYSGISYDYLFRQVLPSHSINEAQLLARCSAIELYYWGPWFEAMVLQWKQFLDGGSGMIQDFLSIE